MKRVIAVFLAAVIGIGISLNALAATAQKTYISELVAVAAENEDEAAAQLEEAGYKLLPGSNVNSSLETGVFIGYKETDNAGEAVTGIAGMNMKGKFSYSDYKTIMQNNAEAVKETIDGFEPVIAEFQANYEAGKPAALAAFEGLNTYRNDDSGTLMGDYLLAYDFGDEAKKQMTDTFMQANSDIILAVMQQTAFAADDSDDSLIDRMVKTGPDGIAEKYRGIYPSVAKANQAMAAEYGDTAALLYKDWNSVYEYILGAEQNTVEVDEKGDIHPAESMLRLRDRDEAEYNKAPEQLRDALRTVDAVSDYADIAADEIDYALYNLLCMTEYGDGTLLDFFKRPAAEVKKEELYPLVDAMSEGQRSQAGLSGLLLTLESALTDIEKDSKEAKAAVADMKKLVGTIGEISIFEGVDRSIFEDGVAFTSAAAEHELLTGESWFSKLGFENEKTAWMAAMIVSGFITGTLVATCVTATFLQRAAKAAEKARVAGLNAPYTEAQNVYKTAQAEIKKIDAFVAGRTASYKSYTNFKSDFKAVLNEKQTFIAQSERAQQNLGELEHYSENPRVGYAAGVVKCVSFVLLVVALAVNAYTVYEFITAPEATEESIPHHIMTTAQTEYGEDYVYYQTLKNLNGEAQDTNNHEADAKTGWLMLYTTKDKAAGDPILAENLAVKTGSADFGENVSAVSLFNETAALNLTDEKYTGRADKANGTYITFTRDASTLVGSAVTGGTAALIGIGGAAIGAVLGAVITKYAGKKKSSAEA